MVSKNTSYREDANNSLQSYFGLW